MNFFLALFWLLLGVSLLVWQALTGDPRARLPVPDCPISYGWFMLVLSAYNLWRWRRERRWRIRQQERREQERVAQAMRRHIRQAEAEEPPNPDFRFTDDS